MNALDAGADLSTNDVSKITNPNQNGHSSFVLSTLSKKTIEMVRKMKAGEASMRTPANGGAISSRLIISEKNSKAVSKSVLSTNKAQNNII
jgi:hypothetical protein